MSEYIFLAYRYIPKKVDDSGAVLSTRRSYFNWIVRADNYEQALEKFHTRDRDTTPEILVVLKKDGPGFTICYESPKLNWSPVAVNKSMTILAFPPSD